MSEAVNLVKPKTILHVDINSYFATILQQENPSLRNKPVAVVKDVGRTCIIAASKEAKKLGIGTGTNVNDAKNIAPNLVVLGAEFDRFLDATKRIKKIFESVAPLVQIYSLDEAFIDVSDCRSFLYPNIFKLGRIIQDKIKDDLGSWVTCNVGIGFNRLTAKIASEISPKGSVFEVNHQNLDAVLASIDFSDVCGIGIRLSKKLKKLGITNPYVIRFFSEDDLNLVFGPFWSKELLRIAYGQESHNLALLDEQRPHMKSVSRSITGWKLCNDENQIRQTIYNLTLEVAQKARKMDLVGRQVFIGLSGSGHINPQWWADHQTLPYYTNHAREIFNLLYHNLYCRWNRTFPIIRFRVGLSLLKPITQVNQSLLPSWWQQEAVESAVFKLSNRYGLFTIRPGTMLNANLIRPEVTGFLGDKKYQLG